MISNLQYRGDLLDNTALTQRLVEAGLSPEWAASKAELLGLSVKTLRDRSGGQTEPNLSAFFVPGRIEVLGKHTDYCGGSSLLAAAEQGFVIACSPRDDRTVRITDVGRGETIEFSLDGEIVPTVGEWSNYPMTVARRMARNFPGATHGAEIAFGSDLPPASGMSSSSAMIIAFFLAMADVDRIWEMPQFKSSVTSLVELASYLATNENGQNFGALEGDRGVGTAGGSEDHTAILCCHKGTLSQYAYCPARHIVDVPLPPSHTLVIASSGVVAEKTGAAMEAYNRSSRLAGLAAQVWREATGRDDQHLAAAIASCSGDTAEVRHILGAAPLAGHDVKHAELLIRFDHFCRENEEAQPAAVAALQSGDMIAFGHAVDESQKGAEDLLGNQIAETKFLAAEARQLGALAASAFGAGFGGSVWALVEASQADEFRAAWQEFYGREHSENEQAARFFLTGAGPAAMRIA